MFDVNVMPLRRSELFGEFYLTPKLSIVTSIYLVKLKNIFPPQLKI